MTDEALTLDEAFGMCMEVWEILSLIDDFDGADMGMKNDMLIKVLGYERCSCGCPFCEYSERHEGCDSCLIFIYNEVGCNYTPYEKWSEETFYNHKHDRSLASEFFDFLCTIYKKHYGHEYGEKV